MWPVVLIGSMWFWIALAVVTVAIVAMLAQEDDTQPAAVFTACTALVLMVLFTDAFHGARLIWLAVAVLAYLLIGAGWALWSFYRLCTKRRAELLAQWQANDDPKRPTTFAEYAKGSIPTAANNKGKLIGWIGLWPFSMAWQCFTWPRHVFTWLYNRLATTFDRIAAKVFAG